MPLYPDDLGSLGVMLAGIAWAAFLLPPVARVARAVRADRKARR
ncbi:hypothetical protein GMYAFLOJ_CDS0061 [Microbacterium phage phiMiGM15]